MIWDKYLTMNGERSLKTSLRLINSEPELIALGIVDHEDGTTPLSVKEDIEDVSSELENGGLKVALLG
ncbi:hypothetical protein TNCV_2513481 [Trichonephila clavipes]|nr:hypothetical protein TNCV_2513481 [Trichonephila clavipes]